MGRLLRENYWFPAIQSHRLVADGRPIRVRLLGDNYVAFRATDGRVGFFPEACPHRRVSLTLARNEDNALRCIFHGWKFSVDGTVLEVPTQAFDPAGFCKKVPLKHFETREAADLVWVFLGKKAPRFPDFEFMKAAGPHVAVTYQECRYNWVQSLDGLADSAHIGIMHQDFLKNVPGNSDVAAAAADLAPTYEFLDRPAGFQFAAVRRLSNGRRYLRVSEFVAPWYTFIAYKHGYVMVSVPIDDSTTGQYLIQYKLDVPVVVEANAFDDPANWPPYPQGGAEAYWSQDRAAMARGAYSGFSIHTADFAVAESQGPITDRSQEFLHDSDRALIRLRLLLIDAAKEARSGGIPTIAQHLPEAYSRAWVGDLTVGPGEDWRCDRHVEASGKPRS
jgi:phenylpropionate dioxygenase-like ring-hydroxylating dioxygenase large terminal subunit